MASRNVFFFFELLFWPIVGVVSIGLMTRFLGLSGPQASFVLVGTIALSVVNVCQLDVAYAVLMDVWSKSIKHQFLAPIGIRHLLARRDGAWRRAVRAARRARVVGIRLSCLRGGWRGRRRVPGWLLPERVDRGRAGLRAHHALRQPRRIVRMGQRQPRAGAGR